MKYITIKLAGHFSYIRVHYSFSFLTNMIQVPLSGPLTFPCSFLPPEAFLNKLNLMMEATMILGVQFYTAIFIFEKKKIRKVAWNIEARRNSDYIFY